MASARQIPLEWADGHPPPAPAKHRREVRHRCTLCGSRKGSEEFPLTEEGVRKHVTCTKCLEASFTGTKQWHELGLRMPEKGNTGQKALQEPPHKKIKMEDEIAQVTCQICAENKPCTEFIPIRGLRYIKSYAAMNGVPIPDVPYPCMFHIALDPQNKTKAVCRECVASHLVAQLQSLGAERLSCITSGCTVRWGRSAFDYLSTKEDQEKYGQQLFDAFWRAVHKWECPDGCDTTGMCTIPQMTAGYPHVECYGCKKRFCALCRVPWHTSQTCQQFRKANPELAYHPDQEDEDTLKNMAEQGARRCPRCQMIILKAGGCDGIQCEKCYAFFDWKKAELVAAPGNEEETKTETPDTLSIDGTRAADADPALNGYLNDEGDARSDNDPHSLQCEATLRQEQAEVQGRDLQRLVREHMET